jgi:hypothetical protein
MKNCSRNNYFETETTCQYISKFERNENLGSLDLLVSFFKIFFSKKYFDFGSSNEERWNAGLSLWKRLGSTVIHDFYELRKQPV